ncbi:aspartyl(acid) protease [Theileria orientalis strain Shintoku]|uniref:Aspartyl(Acid) protease n=1 Tax=Theileria orientalis strain Shintoku TaxID=869250 RepID=J4D8Q9_THEOR|nr:aspartyl(acid) protease [Theileria orientalis strain Shintoku]BAM40935.1 aspartyl(acid) protease [Theileria orientalis strain Shintoku]|eukprot:XP_009691236.1 aspartyl(acid) protease [Theileria orientalis strain Shintoku]
MSLWFILWLTINFGNNFYGIRLSLGARINPRPSKRSVKSSFLRSTESKPEASERDNDNYGFVKGLIKVKVFGNLHKFAYYYVYVGIGNPKTKQMLIIDTGSQLINVACGKCKECGNHLLPNYELGASVTHKLIDCDSEFCKAVEGKCGLDESCLFNESYSEGSNVEGKVVGDLISFDIKKDSSYLSTFFNYIGCVTNESQLIKSQITNGILGLAKSDKPTLISHEYFETQSFIEKYLTDHFRPMKKIFSLCLSENGGVMTLGGVDDQLNLKIKNTTQLIWAPLVKSEFYIIKVLDASFQENKIEFKNKNFVLDTGTTISTLEKEVFNKIHKIFEGLCEDITKLSNEKKTSSKCTVDKKTGKMCFSDISKLPSIVLTFENGSNFEWTSDSYMINRTNKRTVNDYSWWCLGIESSKSNEYILGATFFKNNHVIFDLNKDVVGKSRNPIMSLQDCPLENPKRTEFNRFFLLCKALNLKMLDLGKIGQDCEDSIKKVLHIMVPQHHHSVYEFL